MKIDRRFYVARAWAVHLYTSLGLICSFLGITALLADRWQQFFLWLGVALFIDATDGTLARKFQVKKWTPNFDGRKLDDITDYINYAFLPIFFAYRTGMVGGIWTGVLLFALLAAAYGFCQGAAKTNDGYFTGFPNFWNIVIFYLFLFKTPAAFNAIVILLLALLIWVPVKYISFSTVPLRGLTMAICLVYGVMLAILTVNMAQPNLLLLWGSLLVPLYYTLASLYLTFQESRRSTLEVETKKIAS